MRLSTMTVYRLLRSSSLPSRREGNRYLIRPADVDAYLANSYFRAV